MINLIGWYQFKNYTARMEFFDYVNNFTFVINVYFLIILKGIFLLTTN